MEIGGVGVPQQSQGMQQTQAELSNVQDQIQTLTSDLKELSNELMGGQATAGTKQKGGEEQGSTTVSQKDQQAQKTSTMPQDASAAAAASASEEEKKLSKEKSKKSFDEKLELLMALEESMMDVEMDTEEEKAILEQFFNNMGRIRKSKGRLKQLEEQEEKLEKKLEEMKNKEVSEKVEDSAPSPQSSNIPSHIQMVEDPSIVDQLNPDPSHSEEDEEEKDEKEDEDNDGDTEA